MGSSAVGAAASRTVAYSSAAAVALAIAAAVRFSSAATGSHGVSSWGPLGLVVMAAAAAAACSGRRVGGRTAAAAALFAAVGAWAVASTEWGGIRSVAWTALDQFAIAGAALALGALLVGGPRSRAAVLAGVVAGQVALAIEVLVRLGVSAYPGDWWTHRFLVGPAGYKNAQAALAALAVPLALWFASASRPAVRAAGAVAAALLLSTMLLTQSRGALAGVVIATAAQVALLRNRRVAVAAGALVAAGLVLAYPLTRVDNAALTGSPGQLADALRNYAAVGGAAAALGALVVLARGRFPRRGLAGVTGLIAAVVLVVGGVHGDRVFAAVSQTPGTGSGGNADVRAPGETALTGLSSNGRWDAWRVAWRMIEHDPLRGQGVGSFSVTWLADPHQTLHLLQPHSIELELWAELGLVGLALFAAGCGFVVAALRRAPDRAAATAAGLALLTLLVQSSVDWTWSFPGAVVPALLVVGAAAGSSRGRMSASARISIALAATLFLVSVGAPYLADRKRRQALALAAVSPAAATDRARTAHRIDPLNPDVMLLQGRLAEAAGSYAQAAQSYAAAARESREQWLGFGDAARAWKRAGNRTAAIEACRDAILASPSEQRDLRQICSGRGGRSWPVERLPHTSFDAYRAAGCTGCTVRVSGDRTRALVAGWADFESMAFRSMPVSTVARTADSTLLVEDEVSLPRERIAGDLGLLELRDRAGALLFALVTRGPSGVLALYNPAGGIYGESFVLPTRTRLVPGGRPRCVKVAYARDRFLRVTVDGRVEIRMPGPGLATPSGARTGRPARLLVGILGYDGTPVDGPLQAGHVRPEARIVGPHAVDRPIGC